MRFPRIFCLFIFLVSPVLLFSGCAEPVTTGQTWEEFRRQWQAKGEVFDYRTHIPKPVPSGKNFAHTPLLKPLFEYKWNSDFTEAEPSDPEKHKKAESLFRMSGDYPGQEERWQTGHALDLVAWQEYFRGQEGHSKEAAGKQPGQAAPDVLHALAAFDEEMAELSGAAKARHLCRFDIKYEASLNARVPHLLLLMRASQCYMLRAIARLAAGDTGSALADTEMILFFSECMGREPLLISQLVRISILGRALQAVWEGLAGIKWTNGQLAILEKRLANINLLEGLRIALHFERDQKNMLIDQMLKKPVSEWAGLAHNEAGNWPRKNPYPWLEQNQVRLNEVYMKFNRVLIDPGNRTIHPGIAAARDTYLKQLNKDDPANFLVSIMSTPLSRAANRTGTIQTAIDHARLACALEQHKMKAGEYPGQLADLKSVQPQDPYSGNPYSYIPQPNGRYQLYGIGWNLKDDGGKVIFQEGSGETRVNEKAGDLVWQYFPVPGS